MVTDEPVRGTTTCLSAVVVTGVDCGELVAGAVLVDLVGVVLLRDVGVFLRTSCLRVLF